MISNIIQFINGILWDDALVYMLLFTGALFTWRLRLIQLLRFREMIRTLASPAKADPDGISPFQALCTSLAARVGTGNVAGVAVALCLGGPGATFWMWVVAALGMATAFAESTLAQLFKIRDAEGSYRGGPAFYIARGLNAPRVAVAFSICLIIAFGLVFNAVQANSIADAMQEAFGVEKLWSGVVIATLAAMVILGGVAGVARFAAIVVPIMAGAYLLVVLIVLGLNISAVPGILKLIVANAFGYDQAAGGVAGAMAAAVLNGVKRGLFSNEAGMGSAPNIAAAAVPNPHHPCSQGFVQALGVFIDTIVICTSTALLILLSGQLAPGGEIAGVQLTQHAMEAHLGSWGGAFVAIAVLFFAFTSIVGNYAYAEGALVYLRCDGRAGKFLLRAGLVLMVLWGAGSHVGVVFDLADVSMGVMALINIVAILLLSGLVVRLARDYLSQRDAGVEPEFHAASLLPELAQVIEPDVWVPLTGAAPSADKPGVAPTG